MGGPHPQIKDLARKRPQDHDDLVRYEIMKQFGYYVTESSEHNAEYLPYFIKNRNPELIDRFAFLTNTETLSEANCRVSRCAKSWWKQGSGTHHEP